MGRRRSRRSGPEEMTLNITSMMDMFTIILVFLLFSFKAKDESFSMAKGVKLPKSTSNLELQDAVNIQMNVEALVLQEQVLLVLDKGKLPADVPLEGDKIIPLYDALDVLMKEYRARAEEAERQGAPEGVLADLKRKATEGIVIFQADKRVRFKDVEKVMKTAAMVGLPNFRFAVMKK